jgi:hypothetical protein
VRAVLGDYWRRARRRGLRAGQSGCIRIEDRSFLQSVSPAVAP